MAGLFIGFVGVAILVGLGPLPLSPPLLWSSGLSLLAAVSYGVAAVYTKAKAHGAPPLALATYSQLFAALVLLPAVPFALPHHTPPAPVIASALALALLSTALAFLLYFYLIIHAGPTKTMMVTYLSPVFGILWGALFLGEPLGTSTFASFGLILASVGLVTGVSFTRGRATGISRAIGGGRL